VIAMVVAVVVIVVKLVVIRRLVPTVFASGSWEIFIRNSTTSTSTVRGANAGTSQLRELAHKFLAGLIKELHYGKE
jgi:hypothetical protein